MKSVTYSFSFKVPGAEQYSSVNPSVSYTSDVEPDETPAEAMERVRAFVMAEVAKEAAAPAPKRPAVEDELFDVNNKLHRNLATNIMDHLKIKPERHEAKMTFVLKGKRVGDIRKLLEEDYAAFQAKLKGGRA